MATAKGGTIPGVADTAAKNMKIISVWATFPSTA
jgi:hypothetical protein